MINQTIRSLALITLALSCASSTMANQTPHAQATTAATVTTLASGRKLTVEESTATRWEKIKRYYHKEIVPILGQMAPMVFLMVLGHALGLATGVTPDLTRTQMGELSTLEGFKYAAPTIAGYAAGAALTFALL